MAFFAEQCRGLAVRTRPARRHCPCRPIALSLMLVSAALPASLGGEARAADPPGRPNFVLIFADDKQQRSNGKRPEHRENTADTPASATPANHRESLQLGASSGQLPTTCYTTPRMRKTAVFRLRSRSAGAERRSQILGDCVLPGGFVDHNLELLVSTERQDLA